MQLWLNEGMDTIGSGLEGDSWRAFELGGQVGHIKLIAVYSL